MGGSLNRQPDNYKNHEKDSLDVQVVHSSTNYTVDLQLLLKLFSLVPSKVWVIALHLRNENNPTLV